MGRERIAVIGNGIIGHGVAQVFAMAGHPVVMVGRSESSLQAAMGKMKGSLADFVNHGLLSADESKAVPARVKLSTTLGDAGGSDLVIEAVTEDLQLKLKLFGELDALCPPKTILASSSGQPASALIENVVHRERVIATHFWYPPQLIPLVEICGGPYCAPEILARTVELIRGTGKEPVVIEKEVKGFIGNRLQFALLREAWQLWADGIASAEAIDAVVRASFGRRIGTTGPIESADIGGLATMVNFGNSLIPDLATGSQVPGKVAAQVKDSAMPGIYDWARRDAGALRAQRMSELFRWLKADRDIKAEVKGA
jgi:3-hydroxybutyryl-CoA dehydrogenase